MLVAPSAMGKSTIMNEVVRMDSRFSRVRSFTTRPPRDNDEPGHYIYLTVEELTAHRTAGDVVTEVTFPTTGQTYGTLTSSFTGEYCLLDTLANSVDEYRALPFKQTMTIGVTAPLDQWRKYFLARYPSESPEALKRLEEAKLSIRWSLADPETKWLVNDNTPAIAAARLIDLTTSNTSDEGQLHAHAILECIDQGAIWI